MKEMLKNLTSSFFLKMVLVLFILKFIVYLYWSIEVSSIDQFLNGILNNVTYLLILYALGMIMKERKK